MAPWLHSQAQTRGFGVASWLQRSLFHPVQCAMTGHTQARGHLGPMHVWVQGLPWGKYPVVSLGPTRRNQHPLGSLGAIA